MGDYFKSLATFSRANLLSYQFWLWVNLFSFFPRCCKNGNVICICNIIHLDKESMRLKRIHGNWVIFFWRWISLGKFIYHRPGGEWGWKKVRNCVSALIYTSSVQGIPNYSNLFDFYLGQFSILSSFLVLACSSLVHSIDWSSQK